MGSALVQGITKQFGSQVVLDDVSIELRCGETVGVVGPNGAGKTTLLRIIAGLCEPDTGTVTTSKGLRVGYLPQEPNLVSSNTLRAEVADTFSHVETLERELHALAERMAAQPPPDDLESLMDRYDRANARFIAAGGYDCERRVDEILGGLGFSEPDLQLSIALLSGGQKCRAALAKLLLQDHRLLLLDEPTNHLDIDAVRWLEKFLAGHHGGAVVISHDRYLLDRLADRIIEVDRTQATVYRGNYTTYAATRERQRLSQMRQREKDAAFIEKERAFIAKHMAGQRTKEAQGRRTRLERRIAAGEFQLDKETKHRNVSVSFDGTGQQRGTVLRVEGIAKRYGDKTLFSGLDIQVDAGRRLCITGPNGVGKTTLLKVLLGELEPDEGTWSFDSSAQIGYYTQDAAALDSTRSVLDEIRTDDPTLSEQKARNMLARFLFTGDDAFKPVNRLSGGEQSRLRLLKLMLAGPNVLVLDEPTNHLDIASREVLEESLATFSGAIIAVSHDRYFLDRLADDLLVMRPEGCRLYRGNYSSYVEAIERERTKQQNAARRAEKTHINKPQPNKTSKRETAAYDALAVEDIEKLIIEREEQLADMNGKFADPEVYRDAAAVAELRQSIERCRAELAVIEQAWEERADNLD